MRFSIVVLAFLLSAISLAAQDLVPVEYKGKYSFRQYEKFVQTITIKNQGIVDMVDEYNICHIVLSTDDVYQYAQDEYLGTTILRDLAAGATADIDIGRVGIDAAPGTYYLIIEVDYYNSVQETDEENNFLVIPGITITEPDVDFALSSIWSYAEAYQATDLEINGTIVFKGAPNSEGSLYIDFYLSKDQEVDEDDRYLHGLNRVDYNGESELTFQAYLKIDPRETVGTYYLLAIVDPNNWYKETDETNNPFVGREITIFPSDVDLELSGPLTVTVTGEEFEVEVALKNNGTTPFNEYSVKLYLSPSPDVDYDNQMYDEYRLPSYQQLRWDYSKNSYTIEFWGDLDGYGVHAPPGTYYLAAIANRDGFPERTFDNNVVVSEQTITIIGPPKVAIANAAVDVEYAGMDVLLKLYVSFENSGEMDEDNIYYHVYVIDESGNAIYSTVRYVNALFTGIRSEQWLLTLESPLPFGNYEVEIECVDEASVTSFYEVPFSISPSTYKLTGTIHDVEGIPVSKGKLFLYHKDSNGIVAFTEQRVIDVTNTFSFDVDDEPYTLYFIPDPGAYPEHVPTVLGKTVLLTPTSFITLTGDQSVVFEILKIEPISIGSMTISGNVSDESSGRSSGREGQSFSGIPVVLLSSSGVPCKITTTDEGGNYAFENLPQGEYQVVVLLEPDTPTENAPIPVDLTSGNAIVNVVIGGETVVASPLYEQAITFAPLANKSYGDPPFSPQVSSSSGLPVTLTTSDQSVAKIIEGQVVIVSAGGCTIIATQPGDAEHLPATRVEQSLFIRRGTQVIDFSLPVSIAIGNPDFELTASSSSNLPLEFSSDNPVVATIEGSMVHIVGEGTVEITASQAGDKNFYPAESVTRVLRVGVVSALEPETISVSIYPNPVEDILHIEGASPFNEIQVMNNVGQVRSIQLNSNGIVDLSGLAAGIYFIEFRDEKQGRIFKIVKK